MDGVRHETLPHGSEKKPLMLVNGADKKSKMLTCCGFNLETYLHPLTGISKEEAMSSYITLGKEIISKYGL